MTTQPDKKLTKWQQLAHFFEHGDLTPFAVVISVAHYVPVLQAHGENIFVAAAVGTLIDLLHFRSVRRSVATRRAVDIIIGLLTTVLACAYHLRFYDNDWLLALPVPLGIGILAYHAQAGADSVLSTALAALQAKFDELSAELSTATTERDELQAAADSLSTRVDDLTDQNARLFETNKSFDESIKGLSAELKSSQALVGELREANDDSTEAVSDLQRQVSALQASNSELTRLADLGRKYNNLPSWVQQIGGDFAKLGRLNGSAERCQISPTDVQRLQAIHNRNQK